MKVSRIFVGMLLTVVASIGWAETIRVAIGTQDTTINCATGGLVIRELKLLEKYLPKDGKYKDATYDIVWKNFTSGPPLTNEMVADKLDIGSMADFPGALNAAAFKKAGKKSYFITVLSGSTKGSGNGVVVPIDSNVTSLNGLKGKTVSVPFGSTAHGMLLRALKKQGIDPDKDLTLVSQSPEVGGSALQSHKIDAHADFVPFAELFPYRGFAKKIYDGSDANTPTFHGTLVNGDFAQKYPEVVIAFLRASLEADKLVANDPEKYSELIAKSTGIDAEVNYLFLGPLGVQTRDSTFKPEYRQAIKTAIETLTLLKRNDTEINADDLVDDRYIKEAYKKSGLNYEKQLKNYAKQPLNAKDDRTGEQIKDLSRVTQVWFVGEPKVKNYASPESALFAVREGDKNGKKIRAVYVVDKQSGLKLLGNLAWYVRNPNGQIDAYLQKDSADAAAKKSGGSVITFTTTFSVADKTAQAK